MFSFVCYCCHGKQLDYLRRECHYNNNASYEIGTQHGGPTPHQNVSGNYQATLSSPAGTPHMQQPPFPVNAQINTNQYPQHISTQIHTQGKSTYLVTVW